MNRTFRLTVLVALIASSAESLAQASSSLPVIRPKVTELGEFRDTTLNADLIPDEPSLSPRGTLIAYSAGNATRLWNVSTHSSRILLNEWSEGIVWSPVGDAIAFRNSGDHGSQEQIWVAHVNPATGESIGAPQRVSLTPVAEVAAQFSPSGTSIVFARADSSERSSLVVVPATGGTERVLATGYGIQNLRWAVDGRSIYYNQYQDSAKTKRMLSRVGLNAGPPQVVHSFTERRALAHRWESGFRLSADNRVVMLSHEATGGASAVAPVRDLVGRDLAMLTIPAGVEVDEWSGEYRQVGLRETTPRGLRIIKVANGQGRDLLDSTADVQAVEWFENSRRIAAIVFYDGSGMLVTMNADGTGMQKLPLASQPVRSNLLFTSIGRLRVSPDGRYAVYLGGPARYQGGQSLELVELLTGKQRTLARAGGIQQPFWHRDSKTIRYHRLEDVAPTNPGWRGVHDVSLDGTDKLVRAFPKSAYPGAAWLIGENYASIFNGNTTWLARLDDSPDQLLLRGRTATPGVVSRDGRTIAVDLTSSKDPSRKVMLLSLSDGSQRTVSLPFAEIYCWTFSPDGRSLYCNGRETDSGSQTLYEVPVDGSKPRVVARFDSREHDGAAALSPDGKWLLQTVAGVRRVAFVSLDYTDGMTRVLSPSAKR